ncbi:MAG: hypothetical protein MUC67_02145 [Acidobacteria bacterium]|jgi:hypothetical protein|nr:hypothetical protein [Acidobacteriota bacterium]MCU0253480.1 hypothetical protein [Acidobacteriota bacterium]
MRRLALAALVLLLATSLAAVGATPKSVPNSKGLKTNHNNVFVNANGPNSDAAIWFWNGTFTGASLYWDAAGQRFEFSHAVVAISSDVGLEGYGNTAGGYFEDNEDSGYAYVAAGDIGIEGYGVEAGGFFAETGSADLDGYAYLGTIDTEGRAFGAIASGSGAGGFFQDPDGGGQAFVGADDSGILAYGPFAGGSFETWDLDGGGLPLGEAFLGYTEESPQGTSYLGIRAGGVSAGGFFEDFDSGAYAATAFDTYKVQGTGQVSFVQNHPAQKDKVIVYTAPEGGEVATYTRGSGQLVDGVARIALDPTFAMTTHPEIGLTAHVTPRGQWNDLYVESLTTREIVVRSREATAAGAFDFLVYGLRIGFEETAVVQPKRAEAPIPSMASHRAMLATDPALRSSTAAARFAAAQGPLGLAKAAGTATPEADALREAIGEASAKSATASRSPKPARPAAPSTPASAPRRGAAPERHGAVSDAE